MTTVAWDGKHLSADTQFTVDNMRTVGRKLFTLKSGALFGFAGEEQDGHAVMLWMENGSPDDKKPEVSEGFGALLVTPSGTFLMANKLHPVLLTTVPYAIGSGAQFAMAAMNCGKFSAEAVAVACALDVFTSAPIHSLALTEPEPVPEEQPNG